MEITARELNRATLARQLLLERQPLGVADAVRRVVALQAQEAASPYLALWNRLDPFDPADLDRAFAGHAVVKATLMRVTLHAVHADDYPTFRRAMLPTLRATRFADPRFTATGLSVDDVEPLVEELLAYAGEVRTNADFEAWLADRYGDLPKPGPWWALRSLAPLLHAPTGGPWSFGYRPAYVAARTRLALAGEESPEDCLPALVRRYLSGFGPASVPDIAQFGMVRRSSVREAVRGLAGELAEIEGPGGTPLYDIPDAPRPAGEVPAPPRLMAMWDSVLLAHADRGRVIPPEYRALVIRSNGDVLPTLLVDGYVAGVWRPVDGGVEAIAFHRLSAGAWAGLDAEAGALRRFLAGREPEVYRRHRRWWARLPPAAEIRVLTG